METGAWASARVVGGRYELGAALGRGGMGEVYEGYDVRLARPVAVKMLRPEVSVHPEVRARFEGEARAAARLSHPNVVEVYDTGEEDGVPYLVMERLPGRTLADVVAAGPVDQAWLRRVAGDVLGALGAAHRAGLVHRDVKPGNILVAANGCAKVADFGIAKSMEAAGGLTAAGVLLGTPVYLAPERLEGEPATPRSDLYSLGVVLYEALTGVRPFEGHTPAAVAEAMRTSKPVPAAEARPGVDPVLSRVAEWAMSAEPGARPASAEQMRAALEGEHARPSDATVASELPATVVSAPAPPRSRPGPSPRGGTRSTRPGPRPPAGRTRGPDRARVLAVLAIVAVLVGAAMWLARSTGDDTDAVPPAQRQRLAAQLEDLARRVRQGDGPRGPEAGERLEQVAAQVRSGGGTGAARSLLRDAEGWRRRRLLSAAALAEMQRLLGALPGVDTGSAAAIARRE